MFYQTDIRVGVNRKVEEGLSELILMFDPIWFSCLSGLLFVICLVGMSPMKYSNELTSLDVLLVTIRRVMFILTVGLIIFLPFFWSALIKILDFETGTELFVSRFKLWYLRIFGIMALGLVCRFAFTRYLRPKGSQLWRRLKVRQKTENLSDIQKEIKKYQAHDFLPRKYYKPGLRFVGLLAADKKPAYLTESNFKGSHQAVIGATRYGKGITFQALTEQAILAGDCVIVIDPKGDMFLPRVLKETCARANRRFVSLNLDDEKTSGSWSPFAGGSARDRRTRFYTLMNLADRGTDADHYKALARQGIFEYFKSSTPSTLAKLKHFVENANGFDDQTFQAMSTLRSRLAEWRDYPKLNPKPNRGFNIEKTIKSNAVIYMRGSLDDSVIRGATSAFIIEVIQEARRLSDERDSHISLFVDELRFLISKPLTDALATIAGFNVNITLAFQSLADLESPEDTTLDGKAIAAAVLTNAQIKLIFGGTDADTAEYVSELSGTLTKKVARFESVEANTAGGEEWDGRRMLTDVEEAVIHPNVALSLPKRVGVLIRPNKIATVVSVSPVPVNLDEPLVPVRPQKAAPEPKPINDAPARSQGSKPSNKPKAAKKGSKPNHKPKKKPQSSPKGAKQSQPTKAKQKPKPKPKATPKPKTPKSKPKATETVAKDVDNWEVPNEDDIWPLPHQMEP